MKLTNPYWFHFFKNRGGKLAAKYTQPLPRQLNAKGHHLFQGDRVWPRRIPTTEAGSLTNETPPCSLMTWGLKPTGRSNLSSSTSFGTTRSLERFATALPRFARG